MRCASVIRPKITWASAGAEAAAAGAAAPPATVVAAPTSKIVTNAAARMSASSSVCARSVIDNRARCRDCESCSLVVRDRSGDLGDLIMQRRIRQTVLSAVLVAVAAVFGGVAGPAHAATTPTKYYLALGDSVAFGYAPPQVTPPQWYQNAHNFKGYPE